MSLDDNIQNYTLYGGCLEICYNHASQNFSVILGRKANLLK